MSEDKKAITSNTAISTLTPSTPCTMKAMKAMTIEAPPLRISCGLTFSIPDDAHDELDYVLHELHRRYISGATEWTEFGFNAEISRHLESVSHASERDDLSYFRYDEARCFVWRKILPIFKPFEYFQRYPKNQWFTTDEDKKIFIQLSAVDRKYAEKYAYETKDTWLTTIVGTPVYHGTCACAAQNIADNGVNLSACRANSDFHYRRAFYMGDSLAEAFKRAVDRAKECRKGSGCRTAAVLFFDFQISDSKHPSKFYEEADDEWQRHVYLCRKMQTSPEEKDTREDLLTHSSGRPYRWISGPTLFNPKTANSPSACFPIRLYNGQLFIQYCATNHWSAREVKSMLRRIVFWKFR